MTFKKKDLTPAKSDEPTGETVTDEILKDVGDVETTEPRKYVAKKRQITVDSELSDEAMAQLTKQALDKVEQELMKEKRDKFLASEVERLRAEAGMAKPSGLGGIHDELVEITLDLGYEGQAYIQINQPYGKCYYHGVTYKVPRHVASVLMEAAWRGTLLSRTVKGEKVFGHRNFGTELSAVHGRHDTGKVFVN